MAEDPSSMMDSSKALTQRIRDGETITAALVAGMRFDFDDNTTEVDGWDDLKVMRRTEDGAYVVTVEDNARTYTDAELNESGSGFGLRDENNYLGGFYVWSDAGLDALTTGESWARVVEVDYRIDDASQLLRGFAWLISPTPDFEVHGTQTATYEGGRAAHLSVYPREGYVDEKTSRGRYWGDTTFRVNFSDKTLSGRIDGWENRDNPEEDVLSLALRLPDTDFTLDGFSGTFEAEGLDPGESATLTYDGVFSGPEASAVGTISGTISESDGTQSTAIGFFWGAPLSE